MTQEEILFELKIIKASAQIVVNRLENLKDLIVVNSDKEGKTQKEPTNDPR